MKAMILAAGLGTRLRPWTLTHPKALVPVCSTPMLEHVLLKLRSEGFDRIVVNVHHFASQIIDFLKSRDWGITVRVSDESDHLLDTGGGILKAAALLCEDAEPVLVHNVDILSNAPLRQIIEHHTHSNSAATLLTSERASSRKLVFDNNGRLCGWHNQTTGSWRPTGFKADATMTFEAFSGIHVISPSLILDMEKYGWNGSFPIIDFYLDAARHGADIRHYCLPSLRMIDIGKPETLAQAEYFI